MCCQVRTPREHRVTLVQWLYVLQLLHSMMEQYSCYHQYKSLLSFSLEAKAQRFLKCIDSNYLEFRDQDRTVDSSNSQQIFHWNIRGLRSKTVECMNSLETENINPQVLCVGEHHMEEQYLLHLTLPGYMLELNFCCQNLQKGGVWIVVCKYLYFSKIIISHTVKKRIWKFVLLNCRLNYLN